MTEKSAKCALALRTCPNFSNGLAVGTAHLDFTFIPHFIGSIGMGMFFAVAQQSLSPFKAR
jgi:hypothetical protein